MDDKTKNTLIKILVALLLGGGMVTFHYHEKTKTVHLHLDGDQGEGHEEEVD